MGLEFHAVRLLVEDFEESLSFYKDLLGFSGWYDTGQEYAYFEEKQLALFSRKSMEKALRHVPDALTPVGHYKFLLQFEVEDVDETYRGLIERGLPFLNSPKDQPDWGSRVVHFNDPDGNLLELYQSIR
ncbi:MAG TPA: VOC family protein [Sporolactobacillaceae bacterium]|nr:VOC family protein [Sporolactobacillaceae bacterium]